MLIPRALLLVTIAATAAHATEVASGTITVVRAGGDHVYISLVRTDGQPMPASHCVPGEPNPQYRYAFVATTDAGRATLSAVLTAYAADRTVHVRGTGACTLNPTVEDFSFINLKK